MASAAHTSGRVGAAAAVASDGGSVGAEETLRAGAYRLLASLLSAAPNGDTLALVAGLEGDETPFGEAIGSLAGRAGTLSAEACADEYQTLFIGLGRGEIVPFASYYLTGFLHEKPLAKLREDMSELGIERDPGVSEPEDHAASVLEIMAGLIDGTLGTATREAQDAFFRRHIDSWMAPFFTDLQRAQSADLYREVGKVGAAFLSIEVAALAMT